MGDRVAWGVFKGLFAFFILLPIGGCIALVILGGGLASFENARENAQRDTSLSTNVVKATSTMDTPKFKRPLALQREQVRQQAALMQEEALRIEQQKRVEQLFEYRRQSALKGSPSASFDLGLMFLHGEGTETNVGLGLRWIKTAANNGYGSAIEFLKTHQP
jgi:TPR repeat protein